MYLIRQAHLVSRVCATVSASLVYTVVMVGALLWKWLTARGLWYHGEGNRRGKVRHTEGYDICQILRYILYFLVRRTRRLFPLEVILRYLGYSTVIRDY